MLLLYEQLFNCYYPAGKRSRAAFILAWLERVQRAEPLVLSSLRVNHIQLRHLPAEPFVEYHLRAQQIQPNRFVAVAAYGDGGPWYIPTSEEYDKGGYELTSTFCDASVDDLLTNAIKTLLN